MGRDARPVISNHHLANYPCPSGPRETGGFDVSGPLVADSSARLLPIAAAVRLTRRSGTAGLEPAENQGGTPRRPGEAIPIHLPVTCRQPSLTTLRCRQCGGRTRVVATEHKLEVTHRWLRCLVCGEQTRTIEQYLISKPGPKRGSHKTGAVAHGSRNGASVLTEPDVQRLRAQAAAGVPQKELAVQYGIAAATVSRIVTRKLWPHV